MTYKITKGLDIDIPGSAEKRIAEDVESKFYAVKPTDYVGLVPRLLVAEGDNVKAGTPLFEAQMNVEGGEVNLTHVTINYDQRVGVGQGREG